MTTEIDPVTQIIVDAGGRLVGRTRLQKIAYLLHASALERSFRFEYKHYGPFSEGLSDAIQFAEIFGEITQEERSTAWGGSFFVFTAIENQPKSSNQERLDLIRLASKADAVELELAATAVFLAKSGHPEPWGETERRKPEKAANGGLSRAKALYSKLRAISLPEPLPAI